MATTLVNQEDLNRPTGTGLEGRGPDVDLPSAGSVTPPVEDYTPLQVNVAPSVNNVAPDKYQKALDKGYTKEQIDTFLANRNVSSTVEPPISTQQAIVQADLAEVEDLAAAYKHRHEKYSTQGKQILGGVGTVAANVDLFRNRILNPEEYSNMLDEARADKQALSKHIANKLQEEGLNVRLDPETDKLYYTPEGGEEQEITSPGMLKEIALSYYENSGSIVGGYLGAVKGAEFGSKMVPGRLKPLGAAAGFIAGSLVGSASGSSIGTTVDLLANSFQLKEDLDLEIVKTKMIEAGVYDAATSLIASGVIKGAIKPAYKALDYSVGLIRDGNAKAALNYLVETLGITSEQAAKITDDFIKTLDNQNLTVDRVLVGNRAMSDAEKQIFALSSTQEGLESMVASAGGAVPRVLNSIKRSVDNRAKEIYRVVNDMADPNVGDTLAKGLDEYEDIVKDLYQSTKKFGVDSIENTAYRYDIDTTALQPILSAMRETVASNPDRLGDVGALIDRIATSNQSPTFSNLLDFQRSLNELKHNSILKKTVAQGTVVKGKSGYDALQAIDTIIRRTENEIEFAAKNNMPKEVATEWLKQWKGAKEEYSKMSQLKVNAIARMANNSNAPEETLKNMIGKYGKDYIRDREVVNAVLEKVPHKTKVKVEVAAIQSMLKDVTEGTAGSYQAIDFVRLADDIAELNISTREGKHLAKTIGRMADVYKNDINLYSLSGGRISKKRGDATIGTDLSTIAKANMTRRVWNAIQSWNPIRNVNKSEALITRMEKLLANPTSVKTTDAFISMFPKDERAEVVSMVKEYQIAMARASVDAAKNANPNEIYMYQPNTDKLIYTNGKYGKMAYLAPEIANPANTPKAHRQLVHKSEIATMDDVYNVMDKVVTDKDFRKDPTIVTKLVDAGFKGVQLGDRVGLFPKDIIGNKRAVTSRAVANLDDVSNIMDKAIKPEDIANNPDILNKVKAKGFKGIDINGSILKLGE